MQNFTLDKKRAALLIIDVQEKVLAKIDRSTEIVSDIQKVVKGCQILDVPIIVTEQYPIGLGPTVSSLKTLLPKDQIILTKTTFSCMQDDKIRNFLLNLPQDQWIVVGIEAHICILQAIKDLIREKKEVVVLNNAIGSRFNSDYLTALSEMRDLKVRISCTETILFELTKDSSDPKFKEISQLVK